MKKVVFTIQMLVLIALFPVYLVVELNQKTGSKPVNNSPSEFTERPVEFNSQPVLNPKDKELSVLMPADSEIPEFGSEGGTEIADCPFLTSGCLLCLSLPG